MTAVRLTTYRDAIDHVVRYLGGDVTEQAYQDARSAVLHAYRKLPNTHNWSLYYRRGRIATVAPYSTGTVAYDHTGGLHERMVTLTSGTWPEWAAFGSLLIGEVSYDVAERKSATVLTLTSSQNPGTDVAAGTSYRLYRDTYPLPVDCRAVDRMLNVSQSDWLWYMHPREWIERQEVTQSQGLPAFFTITEDPNYHGSLAARVYPHPDGAYQLDFLYTRRPRPLTLAEYRAGTVATTADSATVTGTGTAFTSARHLGAVLRVSADAVDYPTGPEGLNPALEERVVVAVGSATSLTVDAPLENSLSGVKYVLSDPADLEEGAMLSAFLRGCEYEVAVAKRMKDWQAALAAWQRELLAAKAADSRTTQPRAAGQVTSLYRRLRDFPSGPDLG